jgi:hypothetical protein
VLVTDELPFFSHQHFILHTFLSHVTSDGVDPCVKAVLLKICSLYGAYYLEKHMVTLYQGTYFILAGVGITPRFTLIPDQLSVLQFRKVNFL